MKIMTKRNDVKNWMIEYFTYHNKEKWITPEDVAKKSLNNNGVFISNTYLYDNLKELTLSGFLKKKKEGRFHFYKINIENNNIGNFDPQQFANDTIELFKIMIRNQERLENILYKICMKMRITINEE